MRELEPQFKLLYEGNNLTITERQLGTKRIFQIDFESQAKPLIITVATHESGKKFWTSIPEGKQYDAEQIGKLIANYIRAK